MFEKHFTAHGLEKLVDYQVGVKKKTLFQGSKLRPIQSHMQLHLFPLRLKYLEKSQICDLFSPLRLPVSNLLLL